MSMSLKREKHKNGQAPAILVLFLFLLPVLFVSSPAQAAPRVERQTLSLSKDREQDLKKLSELCLFNDLTSADVLWANDLPADSLTAGTTLVIPASKQDILAVWQSVQKQRKGTSETLVSIKLHGVPRSAPRAEPPALKTAKAPTPQPSQTPPQPPSQKAIPPSPAKPQRSAEKSAAGEKVKGGAGTRKPILFLSEDGDSSSGPMRLVISGDNVAVVRLPRPQEPRMPNLNSFMKGISPALLAPGSSSELTDPRTSRGTGFRMIWPVNGAVSSGFGKRGRRSFHSGIDIPMPRGTSIRATRDGVIKLVAPAKSRGFRGYGNVVILDHGGGISTLYAHCLDIKVRQGQRVRQGETLATVGRTGRATTNHVHFEVRVNGKPIDPIPFLSPWR